MNLNYNAFGRSGSGILIASLAVFVPCGAAQSRAHTKTSDQVGNQNAATRPMGSDFSAVTPTEETLHLLPGRSMYVNTRHRLTRIYVTNPAIIESFTASPNQIVITAKQPGTSSVIVWDESGLQQAYLVSVDVNLDLLRESLREALPNDPVAVHESEGRLLLTGTIGTDVTSDAVIKLASQFSKDVSNALVVNSARVKQVQLKVRIVEVDRSKMNSFAFNFFSAGGNNLAGTTTGQFSSSVSVQAGGGGGGSSAGGKSVSITDPLNFLIYSSRLNIGATLQDLENMQVLQILAEPNITTLSGQKANFLAGGEFPFPVVQGGAGTLPTVSVQFRPYGVKLEFTPLVNVDGTIALHVAPEVSSLDYTNAVTISGYTIPALSTRKADTQVVVKSGQSFAISGLLDKRTTDQLGHTPGIANIPVLGQLFKSKSITHSMTELIVIVTPTVIDPMTGQAVAEEPQPFIPFIDKTQFDKSFPTPKKKK